MTSFTRALLAALASLVASGVYFTYHADALATYVGYSVATFLVPPVAGFSIGAVIALASTANEGLGKQVLVSGVSGALAGALSVAYLLWVLSRPH